MGTHVTDYGIDDTYSLRIYASGQVEVLSYGPKCKGRPIKQSLTYDGYPTVKIKRHRVTVHSIVCKAVYGPRPKGYEINHKDGIKTNNHPSNLEYCTGSENRKHAKALGLLGKNRVVTDGEVREYQLLAQARWKRNNKDKWNAYKRRYRRNWTTEQREAWNAYQRNRKNLKKSKESPEVTQEPTLLDWVIDNILDKEKRK